MQFASFEFLVLFIAVFAIIIFVKNVSLRKLVLVIANFVFYYLGGGIYSSIFLLAYIAVVYLMGLIIHRHTNKVLLSGTIIACIVPLLLYKYLPGFLNIQPYKSFVSEIGIPLGLSFVCLNSISYIVFVFKNKTGFSSNPINLILYLSFFPYVAAGPFENPKKMFEEFNKSHDFDYSKTVSGLVMMGMGFFLKVFVAETLFSVINIYYADPQASSSFMLLISTVFFSFAIYADFYGYSIIAKGVARVLGIELVDNFSQPYLSTSITSFWRYWHISFQNWLKENIYYPLGGSKKKLPRTIINIMIVFVVSGLWHGVGYTFLVWGALNGLYIIIEKLFGLDKKEKKGFAKIIGQIYTFVFITIAWVFFKAFTLDDAIEILSKIFLTFPLDVLRVISGEKAVLSLLSTSMNVLLRTVFGIIGIATIIMLDLYEKKHGRIYDNCRNWRAFTRWAFYTAIIVIPVIVGVWGHVSEFMYAQF